MARATWITERVYDNHSHWLTAHLPKLLMLRARGELGDVVLATAGFQAIRRHHPDARIELLTTAPYRGFAEASGLFDAIWIDPRPGVGRPLQLLRLIRTLRARRAWLWWRSCAVRKARFTAATRSAAR